MIKSELILKLHTKYSSLSLNDIEKILDLFLNNIVKGLQNSQKIELRGFGTFSKKINKEKFVRNPRTSQKIFKKENYKIHFKIGKILHLKINSKNM
jgi:integration host factor subunit beta